jgi:sugar lactone lactonase YvrE
MPTKGIGLRFVQGILIAAFMLIFAGSARAYFAPSNGQAATLVLGEPNFTSGGTPSTTQKGMCAPAGVAVAPITHKVFVADTCNNRVLRFVSLYALTNGAAAEAVLGQINFSSNGFAATQGRMDHPSGGAVDAGGRLWVADTYNSRILRFDNASSIASGANANGVLGQTLFSTWGYSATQSGMAYPHGVFVDAGGRLWVADFNNSRVLRFDSVASKANGANADGVLGQTLFTTKAIATTHSGMSYPDGVLVDAGGRLWVADSNNNRVLRFNNAASKVDGANADGVLGQPNFTSWLPATTQARMSYPDGLAVDNSSGRLLEVDGGNHRILVFNAAASLANGANASYVLGQTNFTSGGGDPGGVTATDLWNPSGLFYDPGAKVLWVADSNNDRILMYGKASRYFISRSTAAYDGYVLESTPTSGVGGWAYPSAYGFVVGDDDANRQYRSSLYFDTSALPDNAVLRKATVSICLAGTSGSGVPDPFVTFGNPLADIKNGTFGAAALEVTDFQAAASASAVGHLNPTNGCWYQMALPAAYFPYVSLTGVTQFRVRFALSSNKDSTGEYAVFYAGDETIAAFRPLLSVEYTLP